MIRLQQIKLPITHSNEALRTKICKLLQISSEQLLSVHIRKQSIDARKKNAILYSYTVDVSVMGEDHILKRNHNASITKAVEKNYRFPTMGEEKLKHPPVIIGSGPGGLFCAYELAKAGYCPILLERGSAIEERTKDVLKFWETGNLNTASNVQFGEGGAGTFSDGKLNTLVKDPIGRNREVLDVFISHGAPEEIGYEAKPHIGTDQLAKVIPAIRDEIIRLGGTVRFASCVTNLMLEEERICGVEINDHEFLPAEVVVLAIGHSARDTFSLLLEKGLHLEAKSFAVGMRVEHPQEMMNQSQYGNTYPDILPPAPYKVTYSPKDGRGVYSFCMCPGGFVVNASSEEKRLAVNGMSYHKRDSENANSAIIVAVTPEDFPQKGPLAGVAFQRALEEKAYALAEGKIPQQLYGDFKNKKISSSYGSFSSCAKGDAAFGALHELFPEAVRNSFLEGMEYFGKKIAGFNRADAILSGVESRTSSPVRIHRNEQFESNIKGIYPCGEGAGYAGGIMSAAMDGLKIAEAVATKYAAILQTKGRNERE